MANSLASSHSFKPSKFLGLRVKSPLPWWLFPEESFKLPSSFHHPVRSVWRIGFSRTELVIVEKLRVLPDHTFPFQLEA